jgi:hypothetical protein
MLALSIASERNPPRVGFVTHWSSSISREVTPSRHRTTTVTRRMLASSIGLMLG